MRTSDASRPVSAPEPPGQEVPQNPYVYFEREDWCSLCDCTISNLEQHRNNRVHLVNDLIWETQRKFSGRVWSPAKVFARSPLRSAWEAASHRSGPSTPSWNEFIAAHARLLPLGDPRRRLMILRGMLLLQEVGILRLFEYDSWRFREGSIAYNRGHRALKWLLSLSIHGLFPNGSSGVHSNFLSNCYGSRILADVYDLLQLQSLLPHARVLSNLCLDGTYNDETKKAIVKVTLGELFYLGSPDRNRSQLFQYQYPTSHWKNTNSFLSKDGRGRNIPLSRFDGIPSWIQHLANWLSHSLLTEIMFLRFSKAASVTQKLWWERNLLTETHHSINKGQSSAQMLDDSSTEVNILRNYFYDRLHVKES